MTIALTGGERPLLELSAPSAGVEAEHPQITPASRLDGRVAVVRVSVDYEDVTVRQATS